MTRRVAICLAALLWITGQLAAAVEPVVELDAFGDLNYFLLQENELTFSRSPLAQPQALYTFTREVQAFDARADNTRFYLAFAITEPTLESGVYVTLSKDNGQTFSFPLLATAEGSDPQLASQGRSIWLAWQGNGNIHWCHIDDQNENLGQYHSLQITGETLASPSLMLDASDNIHISFLANDPDTGLNRVVYSQGTSPEAQTLFSSHDKIINLKINALDDPAGGWLVFWQKEYMERRESYFCVSLDNGASFSQARLFDLEPDLENLCLLQNKLFAVIFDNKPVAQEIELQPLPAPVILFPPDGAKVRSADLALLFSLPENAPLIYKIELSEDQGFSADSTWSFSQLVPALSQESITFPLPVKLTDGRYYLRVQAFDGLSSSVPGQAVSFSIDNLAPDLLTLEAAGTGQDVVIKGEVSELPAWLAINDQPVALGTATFESDCRLEPGHNVFTLLLSDEAGNTLITTLEAYYDPACPELTLLNPDGSTWFKPESTIVIEAGVSDLQGDIADGSEAQLLINGATLESSLAFDQEESSIFGIVALPEDLGDGKHSCTITLSDRTGNTGTLTFSLNIDGSAPEISLAAGEPCFSNSLSSITLPLSDLGAGIDPSGTLIQVAGISCEGSASIEGDSLVFTPDTLLLAGTYEVLVVARDTIGNVGPATSFCLVVDTTAPLLTLLTTLEPHTSQSKVSIQAEVEEEYPSEVKIYNNQKEIASFSLNQERFAREIDLNVGSNELEIRVLDRSGNQASAHLSTIASFAPVSGLIAQCLHAPNPFSPSNNLPGAFSTHGKGMVFSYALNQTADIKILIYDLTGTLIWVKEIRSASNGVTAWSGENPFGGVVKNGVYPYVFSARSGELSEIRRGKILVYQ